MWVSSWASTLIMASSDRRPARKIVPNSIVRGSRKRTDALSRESTSGLTRRTASTRAVAALPEPPKHVFVDGRDRLATACDCDAVIGGDGLVVSIAAASIIAKVTRDRLMRALALDCPGYGFEAHKGYAVPEHLEALDRLGPSAHHRRFFAPVVAAREKHDPGSTQRDLFRIEVPTEIEVSVAL